MVDETSPRTALRQVRGLLWLLVGVAILGAAALAFYPKLQTHSPKPEVTGDEFGVPFTLVGSDGRPFSSQALEGKAYALYFGFTRCGDVCPTTLSRS